MHRRNDENRETDIRRILAVRYDEVWRNKCVDAAATIPKKEYTSRQSNENSPEVPIQKRIFFGFGRDLCGSFERRSVEGRS